MCGISGAIGFNKEYLNFKDHFRSSLDHRGPDASTEWLHESVHLNHNRLSIIDLEGGNQPFISKNNEYTLVYNGELYNYKELRQQLEAQGHSFYSESDTEVILNSYIEWGSKCLNRFRGMYAFAIVDIRQELVFLARDHFGIKPLVYHLSRDGFFFASEIQAFRKLPFLNLSLDPAALDEYFWLQYIPAPNTIFKEVKKLPPAHYMNVSFTGQIKEINNYWSFEFDPQEHISQTDWVEQVNSTLKASVEKHLVSDVSFGAFLSGGIDSSLVVSYMAEIMDRPVKTFSIGFDDAEFNELMYARRISKQYNTEHHEEIVDPDALEVLPKLVAHYGEPFGDSSAIPTYYVSKLAGSHVKMVLSGDGGDEGFLGYESYSRLLKGQDYQTVSNFKQRLYPLARKIQPYRYFDRAAYKFWIEINRYYPYEIRKKLYKAKGLHASFEHSLFARLYESKIQLIQKAQFTDLNTYLPFDILTKVDIASMANSLEVRTPLIDVEVWNLISKIPSKQHLSADYSGKQILKSLLAKKTDREFAFRKKQGFSIPMSRWFRDERKMAGRILDSTHLPTLLDKKEIENLVSEGFGHRLWLLLFLDEWLDQFNNSKR